jgi:plastocyanin
MRKLLVVSLTLALFAAAGGHALARPSKSVRVDDDFFVRKGDPPTISVAKGTRVTFHWRGDSLHNVHARTGPATFKSAFKRSGSYSKVLRKPGKYVIFCDIHSPDMKITIKVRR